MITRKSVGISLVLMLIGSALVATQAPASSHTTYSVTVGALIESPRAEATHFFPENLTVHSGDVINFHSNLFHTVTVLTAGQDPDIWIEQNWKGEAAMWSPVIREADEPGSAKANPRVLQPSHPCGWPTQVPCPFAGVGDSSDDVLNSGLPLFDEMGTLVSKTLEYSVEVTAPAGTSLWALSLTNPALRMRIDVVDDAQNKSDPQLVLEASATELVQDRADAAALKRTLRRPKPLVRKDGTRIWRVSTGADTGLVSISGFFPGQIKIRKGDSVRWVFDRLKYQTAMVTFPARRVLGQLLSWPREECDPDSDSGAAEDTAPTQDSFPYCEDFSQLELETDAELLSKQGDNSHGHYREFNSSGIRGGLNAPRDSYTLRFTKVSRKGFKYVGGTQSIFFGSQTVKVIVLPRRSKASGEGRAR